MTTNQTPYLVTSSGTETPVRDEMILGRSLDSAVWLDDKTVSGSHAVIRQGATGFEIEDLKSRNGTYINDVLISEPTLLLPGDRIRLGMCELDFVIPGAAGPAFPAPTFDEPAAENDEVTFTGAVKADVDAADTNAGALSDSSPDFDEHADGAEDQDTIHEHIDVAELTPAAAPAATAEPEPRRLSARDALHLATTIGHSVREAHDLGDLLRSVARQLVDGYEVDGVVMYLADVEQSLLQGAIVAGGAAEPLLGSETEWGRDLAGAVAATRQPQLSNGSDAAGAHALAAPIELRGGVTIGILELIQTTNASPFTQEDLDFSALICQQIGLSWPEPAAWRELARRLQQEVWALSIRSHFASQDPALLNLVRTAALAVESGQPVYIWGEPGSGRSYLVQLMNELVHKSEPRFVELNCSQLSAEAQQAALFESGGAWSWAAGGLICIAHPEQLDAGVLATIAARIAQPDAPALAFTATIPPAAGALAQLVEDNSFHLPPLRDRLDDLPPLIQRIAEGLSGRFPEGMPAISAGGIERMAAYAWPGNITELAGLLLQLKLLAGSGEVDSETLQRVAPDLFGDAPNSGADSSMAGELRALVAGALGEDQQARVAAAEAVRELPQAERECASGALLRALEAAETADQRARGLVALAQPQDPRVSPYIIEALADTDPALRAAAVLALGATAPDGSVVSQLDAVARSDDAAAAMLALLSLGRLGVPAAAQTLDTVFDAADNWRLRSSILSAVTQIDEDSEAARALIARAVTPAISAGYPVPEQLIRRARATSALTKGDIRQILASDSIPVESRARLLRFAGESDASADPAFLADLAPLTFEPLLQEALADQLALQGDAALPAVLDLIAGIEMAERRVGLMALARLPASDAWREGVVTLASSPELTRTLPTVLGDQREAFASAIAGRIYDVWRPEAVLPLMRVLLSAYGDDLPVPGIG